MKLLAILFLMIVFACFLWSYDKETFHLVRSNYCFNQRSSECVRLQLHEPRPALRCDL